jgi:hypothetical protein
VVDLVLLANQISHSFSPGQIGLNRLGSVSRFCDDFDTMTPALLRISYGNTKT